MRLSLNRAQQPNDIARRRNGSNHKLPVFTHDFDAVNRVAVFVFFLCGGPGVEPLVVVFDVISARALDDLTAEALMICAIKILY